MARMAHGEYALAYVAPERLAFPGFRGLVRDVAVPLVAIDGKGRKAALGRVAVSESGGRFRFTTSARPPHVAIDEDKVLAVVR